MTLANSPDEVLDRIRASWNADASTYDARPAHGLSERERWAWRRLLGEVFDPITGDQPLRILDVGTGTGEMALLLANMGYTVSGVDLSPAMLAQAREKATRLGLAVSLQEGRADRLPFADGAVDVVFSRHLFWTLLDPHAALREWTRVVRPGGMVAIADGWWSEPSRQMRLRRAIGRGLRRVFEGGARDHPAYAEISPRLPLAGGVSPYSIRYYLDTAGLTRIRVRDLRAIRRAERQALPPWRWIDQARFTWLATAYAPDGQ